MKDLGAQSGDVPVDDGERVYIAAGDVIAQKYRVDRVLGVGGVGFVLAARHVDLEGYFALKFLKRRFLQDKSIVERFTREAKAACRIRSEYVARVYDVGSHAGAPFIVMEHLTGRDLAALLAERGAFSVGDATEYVVQACAALAVAHASGIVHRDIKPENLFLVDHEGLPTVKLLDFGISKISLAPERAGGEWPAEGEPLTGRLICGTPYYMSPEQVRSTATVDARSDVWSLGMVLYELLSGNTAFVAESIADVCAAILDQEPKALSELRPDISQALSDVIARCLRKDPDDRYPTIAELAVALLPFAPPRALAIAEGSAWIRRAAIQTLGAVVNDDARVSSGSLGTSIHMNGRTSIATLKGAQSTPAPIAPVASSALAAPPPSRKRVALTAAAVAFGATLAVAGAYVLLRGHTAAAVEPSVLGTLPSVSTAAPPAASRPSGTADERRSEGTPDVLVATPSARPSSGVPARPAPPVRHSPPPPAAVRTQSATKTTAVPAPPPLESNAPAAPSSPPRPDLGY